MVTITAGEETASSE